MIEKGTIFRNCYATLRTYFIYDHTITQRQTRDRSPAKFVGGYGLVYIGGKWELTKGVQYYNIDLMNDKNFKPVGKIDIDDLIVKTITKEIEKCEKLIYICDAAKNTKCEKGANCYINGGLCNCTQYPEYARTNEQGKPLEASEI